MIGKVVSHYKILEKLGAGGIGVATRRTTPNSNAIHIWVNPGYTG